MHRTLGTVVLVAGAALLITGCDDPAPQKPQKPQAAKTAKPKAAKSAKPKPKKLTTEEKVAVFKKCWAAFDAKDEAKYGACYHDRGMSEMVDFQPPMKATGGKGIAAQSKPYWTAFPDGKHELGLILVRGNDIVALYSSLGTNKGEMMGKPATDKAIGLVAAQHVRLGLDGKVIRDEHFLDQGTIAAQLGVSDQPARPVREAGKWGETQVIIAKNDKAERDNMVLFRKMTKAFNDHELDAWAELYADEALFSYNVDKEDIKGKEAIKKGLAEYFKMSSDVKSRPLWTWAAGDYLVSAMQSAGTNDGPMPGGKGKATDKKFRVRELNILKIAEGKIAEHHIYANGMAMAVQLGLIEDPSKVAKGDDDEKKEGDDKGKAADRGKAPAPKDKAAAAKPAAPPPSKPVEK